MDSLPKELLIEIFSHLPVADLISLSLVCHKFNNIISNNSKLLENFEIQFISDYAGNEWIGSRKYTKLFIDGSAGIYFLYILKQIGHEIENLIINCYEFSVAILKQMLLMCENVKNLTIYNATNDSEPEDYAHPLPKYDLKNFYFRGEIDVFKIFIDCTTRSLDVRRDDNEESHDVSGLRTFLKSQKNLDGLKIENFDRNSSLFSDELLTAVDFKLKRLKLKNFHDFQGFNFWEFLEHHKDTLWYLEGCNVNHELFTLFRRFKNLRALKIQNMCSDFSALNFIDTLYLKNVDGKWTEKLQNIKKLTISQYIEDYKQLKDLKHLETLKISDCAIPTLEIPTVKRLTLNRVELDETKPFEYENGCEIEELKIVKCKNLEWLLDFLIHKTFNLKSLIIHKSIIIDDDLIFIEDYRNRLKKLEILNCHNLCEQDIDDDLDYDEDFSDDSESEEEEEEEEEENEANSEDSGSGSSDEDENREEDGSGDENSENEADEHPENNDERGQDENQESENKCDDQNGSKAKDKSDKMKEQSQEVERNEVNSTPKNGVKEFELKQGNSRPNGNNKYEKSNSSDFNSSFYS